jgi:hypothetical protein
VTATLERWRKRVLWGDGIVMGLLLAVLLGYTVNAGYWQGLTFAPTWLQSGFNSPLPWAVLSLLFLLLLGVHFGIRKLTARSLVGSIRKQAAKAGLKGDPASAFLRSTSPLRSIFRKNPAGWGRKSRRQLRDVLQATDNYIQTLNDQFTNPSGSEKLLQPEAPANPEEGEEETLDRDQQTA